MKTTSYVLFTLFFVISIKCATTKSISVENIIIELEKTACRGECPVFNLKITSDGIAYFEGKENVDKIGQYKSKLNMEQVKMLIDEFDKSGFFNFEDSYKSVMMDLPTKYISYTKDGRTKKIKAYDNVPKKINYLIGELDKLISSLEWKKINT